MLKCTVSGKYEKRDPVLVQNKVKVPMGSGFHRSTPPAATSNRGNATCNPRRFHCEG